MNTRASEELKGRNDGRNIQIIRAYVGIKQYVLASEIGVSQQKLSEIENQKEIDEELLLRIAGVLCISIDTIKNFDAERAINNINNYKEQANNNEKIQMRMKDNPIDKIIELYERLLECKKEKIEILKNK